MHGWTPELTCRETFLITVVSTGLGRAIAAEALRAGHMVVGTLRDLAQAKEFEDLAPGRAQARILDVTDHDQVTAVVNEVTQTVGPSTCWSITPITGWRASPSLELSVRRPVPARRTARWKPGPRQSWVGVRERLRLRTAADLNSGAESWGHLDAVQHHRNHQQEE
ncbi:SDR family NAD(P)-dependent oxidoreductase [Streptomyces sp. NPDC059862]|uniref:SDR family NAD(P)-dependent oxidoreductase n=1 Tax=unclassified Streptomyces TaxID=2593676 RepID=UPI0036375300